jgi:hypothetical protein
MPSPAPLPLDAKSDRLVERVKSARAGLHLATDPGLRSALLIELTVATQELSALILGDTYPRCLAALVSVLEMERGSASCRAR